VSPRSDSTQYLNDGPNFFVEQSKKAGNVGSIFAAWPRPVEHHHRDKNFNPIELIIRGRLATGVSHDFGAILYFPRISRKLHSNLIAGWPTKANLGLRSGTISQLKQLVLVSYLELIENGKEWRKVNMLSVVRLALLDSFPNFLTERHEPTFLTPLNFEEFSQIGNIRSLSDGGRILAGLEDADRVNKVVKDRSKIVDGVSNHKAPPHNWWIDTNMRDQTMFREIGIVMSRDRIGIAVAPYFNLTLNGLSMFVGATQFREDARKA
jgi:hypothetical protein